ncbi:MAG: fatty acid desaturase [Myxococcota bacterium]|nr:fatty acid desaturase [Myxococcota bacterium]
MPAPRPTIDPQGPVAPVDKAWEAWFARRLYDERDIYFVRIAAAILLHALPGLVLFYGGFLPWWLLLVWAPYFFFKYVGPYTLMLHAVCHRPIFRREHKALEGVLSWVIGPLFGHTPGSFYVHHVGMHHPENNLPQDLSTTMPYERDSFVSFLHYWARFFFTGQLHLVRYLKQRKRSKLMWKFVWGELSWFTALGLLLWANLPVTFLLFVVPFLMLRVFMMSGNFGQHAFVDPERPHSAFGNSTNLLNHRYNRKCHNDGYHIVHHIKPALHWTEMPAWYEDRLDEFGREDALVFDGLGNNQVVWWCLMTKNYDRLARHVVDLPGAPVRSHEEKIAWLQSRTRTPIGRRLGILELAPSPVRSR